MTVATTTSSVTLLGNGSTTVFNYSFEIPYQDDGSTPAAVVYITSAAGNTVLTPAQYSITGVGNPAGGAVTYTGGGTPLPSGDTITISRAKFLTQPYAFPNTSLLPQTIEQALDNIVLEMQQLATAQAGGGGFSPTATRIITSSGGAPIADTDYFLSLQVPSASITITLPVPANYKGRTLVFKDGLGNAGAYPTTFTVSGGGTIDGNAHAYLAVPYVSFTFISDGTQWSIV